MPRIISTNEVEEHNKEDVNEMFDSLANPEEGEEEEQKQEMSQEQSDEITEPEATETVEAEEETGEEESEQQAQGEETQADEESEDEVTEKLRQRIAELETGKAFKGEEEQGEEPQKAEKKEETKETEKRVDDVMQFVTDEEFEEIQSDPKKLNDILVRVYQRARQDTMRDVPELVQQTTQRQVGIQEAVKGFYEENSDLRPHAQYVGYVATQVRAENPELAISDILKKTETKVRENLAISKSAKAQEEHRRKSDKKGKDAPAFAKSGSGNHKGGKTDDRSGFAKQVDAMMSTVNR